MEKLYLPHEFEQRKTTCNFKWDTGKGILESTRISISQNVVEQDLFPWRLDNQGCPSDETTKTGTNVKADPFLLKGLFKWKLKRDIFLHNQNIRFLTDHAILFFYNLCGPRPRVIC